MALVSPQLRTYYAQIAVADVNTGVLAVPRAPGRIYTVVDGWMRAIGGAAGSLTSIDVTDDTTGTVALSFEAAGLAENAVLRAGATNTTVTNAGTALTQGEGILVKNVGTAVDTATHVDVCIHYLVTSVQA